MELNNNLPEDDPDGLIKAPGTIKSASPVIVIPASSETPDTQIKEEEFKKIENFDLRIQTIEDGITKVTSLSEIEKSILGQESVGQMWAKEVNNSFGGKFFEQYAFESFTVTPTKTNYRSTLKFMREKIAMEHIAVSETFNMYLESLGEMLIVLREVDNRYLGAAQLKASGIRNFIEEFGHGILENPIHQVNYGGEFCHIADIDLTTFDAGKLSGARSDMVGTIENLKIILESGLIKTVILGALASKSLYESMQSDSMSEFHAAPISINDLIELYGNGVMDNILEQLNNDLPVYMKKIEELKSKAEELIKAKTDVENINGYIMDNTATITEVKSYFNKGISFMNKIIEFFMNSEMIFEYLAEKA